MIIHEVDQRADEWRQLRLGAPTASEFSKIVTSKGEPSKSIDVYARTLAGELFAGKELDGWEGNVWTERGREKEPEALAMYEFLNDVQIRAVGFVTDDEGQVGCSPDGFVGDEGLVEIKNLKAENHIKTILYYRDKGRCPPDYIQQSQGQMMICERQWCDLVFYHPDLPLLVIRQEPIKAVVDGLKRGVPEILKRRDVVLAALRDFGDSSGGEEFVAPPSTLAELNESDPVF